MHLSAIGVERCLSTVLLGDVLLISDYGKGVCTKRLLWTLVERAHDANVPILIDPARSRNWSDYGQVTLIKANWSEATEAAGNHDTRPVALAMRLADSHECHIVITLGEHGLVCAERTGDAWSLPAKRIDPHDVCGAGDTVLATFGMGLARRDALRDSCELAVMTAAEQVSHIGASPILDSAFPA